MSPLSSFQKDQEQNYSQMSGKNRGKVMGDFIFYNLNIYHSMVHDRL